LSVATTSAAAWTSPAAVVERADEELGERQVGLGQVEEVDLLDQALGERRAGDRDLLEELDARLALRHIGAVERAVLHVLRPVDRVVLGGLGRFLVGGLLGRVLARDVLALGELVDLLEQRVLHDLLLEDLLQLEGGNLKQLERLLEALRHDERRLLRQVQRVFHLHRGPRLTA
jgi:hypothetical protein